MRRGNIVRLALILLLAGLALAVVLVKEFEAPALGHKGRADTPLGMSLGLDLRGGTHLVYEADLSKRPEGQSADEAMAGALDKIERRVNAYGVSEPAIQKQGENRISVQLPGIRNIEEAIDLIGGTAQLEFIERTFDSQGVPVDKPTGLSGDDFKRAWRGTHPEPLRAGEPVVYFEFKKDAAQTFADLTTRLYGTSGQIAIFLDKVEIMSPTVRSPITEGTGFIEGNFTLAEARTLAIKLNEGALPVPLKGPIIREDVDPTLGKKSINKSLLAGGIGLAMVVVFMVLFYRLPGLLASGALLIYALLVLAAFKLIPVTLSLAGVAGFILSIGMAVDANVLIFERLKEELRSGRTLGGAIEVGFSRAWSAIWDSNFTTLISCAILYWLGSTFGEPRVMGFALTLSIGIALSMLTAITVTRNFLGLFVGTRWAKQLPLFGVQRPETTISSKEQA